MTFRDLMEKLGQPRPMIVKWRGSPHFGCDLPFQPLERLKGISGCSIFLTLADYARFDIPVDEGVARIVGSVQVEEDCTQTLIEVTAFRVDRQLEVAIPE